MSGQIMPGGMVPGDYSNARTDEQEAAERRAARRVRMPQVGGDDGYHYVLIVDGIVRYRGMTRDEARPRRQRAIKNLAAGRRWSEDS